MRSVNGGSVWVVYHCRPYRSSMLKNIPVYNAGIHTNKWQRHVAWSARGTLLYGHQLGHISGFRRTPFGVRIYASTFPVTTPTYSAGFTRSRLQCIVDIVVFHSLSISPWLVTPPVNSNLRHWLFSIFQFFWSMPPLPIIRARSPFAPSPGHAASTSRTPCRVTVRQRPLVHFIWFTEVGNTQFSLRPPRRPAPGNGAPTAARRRCGRVVAHGGKGQKGQAWHGKQGSMCGVECMVQCGVQ